MTQSYSFEQIRFLNPGKSFDELMAIWNEFEWSRMNPKIKAELEIRAKERADVVKAVAVNR